MHDRQATYQGFGDAMAMAFELVMTPLLFALAGFGLDRFLGTTPIFLIVFSAFAIVGLSIKTYYSYKIAMEREEDAKPWTRSRP